ncbi:hypothetical protein [Klebsiella michiganensis]|uniref:hypothetical protein n=1 Tax=Klebsiella michiganensis TaxID=1134687 RepID=UPI00066599B3|nr:hypothetical protein [Klebsiella michiganensis]MBC3635151.1 hypothetical protein [Klebsiella michiganensis]MDS7766662.1 hypothetical protein [Klebsiella michiganensis]MDS7824350.1 hypothetical protein [Klebsiella michiganensis]MDS7835697.1 hypothetical protein [Klebsiella michiganensis]UYY72155.1 hypothetical protein OKE89_25150 [Klebsiella michiganensis]
MMNTALNSREEALNQGKLINLDDKALDAGLPLDLAITLSAHKHCLEDRNDNAIRDLLKGVEMVVIVAFIAHQPPQRTIRIDYRSVLSQKTNGSTQQQTVRLTLRVHFSEQGIPIAATLGLMGERFPY